MQSSHHITDKVTGWWKPDQDLPESGFAAIHDAILRLRHPVYLVRQEGEIAAVQSGTVIMGREPGAGEDTLPLCAYCPPLHPADLGDPVFRKNFGLRFAYVADAMANGITSVEMTEAAGRAGMLAIFGAAGLSLQAIEKAIRQLQNSMKGIPFGFNLIHSPNDPDHEAATVALYLKNRVRIVSASAYLGLTLPVVHYRIKGIHRDQQGKIVCPNKLIGKVSREEVAEKFLSPPPEKLLRQLVEKRMITEQEAELSRFVPMCGNLTAEADSGGHTDNRPALTMFPTMVALRDRLARKYNYSRIPCVGLGGGIATPESAAAAFAMGAAYLVTGSVNQACTEAGTSQAVRQILAEARQADVIMAPAADMFEMGVKVQVLKRGTMFPLRAAKLLDLYNHHDCYENIPLSQRQILERDFFQSSFDTAWAGTKAFFERRDPRQNIRAENDPKHKMALVFRSYLGQSSRWAISGDPARRMDYQIWCGPAIGAFNEWTKGSFLEKPENRQTVTVAMNLLTGAAVVTRANWLRSQGIVLPPDAGRFSPLPLSKIKELTETL